MTTREEQQIKSAIRREGPRVTNARIAEITGQNASSVTGRILRMCRRGALIRAYAEKTRELYLPEKLSDKVRGVITKRRRVDRRAANEGRPVEKVSRHCLRCRAAFEAHGRFQRLCSRCRSHATNDHQFAI